MIFINKLNSNKRQPKDWIKGIYQWLGLYYYNYQNRMPLSIRSYMKFLFLSSALFKFLIMSPWMSVSQLPSDVPPHLISKCKSMSVKSSKFILAEQKVQYFLYFAKFPNFTVNSNNRINWIANILFGRGLLTLIFQILYLVRNYY